MFGVADADSRIHLWCSCSANPSGGFPFGSAECLFGHVRKIRRESFVLCLKEIVKSSVYEESYIVY